MSNPYNIMEKSPHDLQPEACAELAQVDTDSEARTWVPSRYNVRATTEDGRLILWNTWTGAISVFQPEQRSPVQTLLKKKGFEARPEGIVEYLRNRGFLVEKGTDENRRLLLTFGRQHYRTDFLELIILSSEDCNFRCTYCYEPFPRGTMLPWVRAAVKKFVAARADRLKNMVIQWFGGEPLYGLEAVEDLAPFFHEIAEEHSMWFYSNMTTNGYLLTPEVADKLLSWRIRSYQITVDGPPEDHNRSRPGRDGRETFSTIFDNLKSLSRRDDDYRVILRTNFSKENHSQMNRFIDIVEKELHGDPRFRIRFHAVDRWGGTNDDQLEIFDRNEGIRVQEELMREACRRNIPIRDNLRDRNRIGAYVCGAGRPNSFMIGASGKVMKCTLVLDKEDFNVVGKIDQEGNLNLDEDKLARWAEPVFETDAKCRKCVFLPTCQGLKCPVARLRTGKPSCISTRFNPKGELLTALQYSGDNYKTAVVTTSPAL